MRARLAALLLVLTVGGCTAFDDFGRFGFGALDGSVGDLEAAADLASVAGSFGKPCTQGSCPAPLTCIESAGSKSVPGGMCTHSCTVGTPNTCSDVGGDCGQVEGMELCLPRCSLGRNCRTLYGCCASQMVTTGAGNCAPVTTDFCGH